MKFPSKEFIEEFKRTPGAISVSESIAIGWLASQAPSLNRIWIDLGSHKGKSSMSALAHQNRRDGELVMIDPIYGDIEIKQSAIDLITKAGINVRPRPLQLTSLEYLEEVPKHSIGYIFVDSNDHNEEYLMKEMALLEDQVAEGGVVAFHDFLNQFVGVKVAYDYLVSTGKYIPIEIPWDEIVAYVKENDLEKGNNSWHMPGVDFPAFVGALKRI